MSFAQSKLRVADEESPASVTAPDLGDVEEDKLNTPPGQQPGHVPCRLGSGCTLLSLLSHQAIGRGALRCPHPAWTLTPPHANDSSNSRMWSNVDQVTMRHQPGSVLGAVSLVAGTAVGAGILALPATTAPAGFAASAAALTGGAAYTIVTALLLAEVNLNTMCELGSGGVSIVSMASRTLGAPLPRPHGLGSHFLVPSCSTPRLMNFRPVGTTGTRLASGAYLFLHYCLLVACRPPPYQISPSSPCRP